MVQIYLPGSMPRYVANFYSVLHFFVMIWNRWGDSGSGPEWRLREEESDFIFCDDMEQVGGFRVRPGMTAARKGKRLHFLWWYGTGGGIPAQARNDGCEKRKATSFFMKIWNRWGDSGSGPEWRLREEESDFIFYDDMERMRGFRVRPGMTAARKGKRLHFLWWYGTGEGIPGQARNDGCEKRKATSFFRS